MSVGSTISDADQPESAASKSFLRRRSKNVLLSICSSFTSTPICFSCAWMMIVACPARVARVRRQRERELLAVLVEDAVPVGVLPSRVGEQLLRLLGSYGERRHLSL